MDSAVFISTFALIFLAEIGDKSQLMVVTLASRYRALPVIIGTFSAFALLNLLAVLFGGSVSRLVPRPLLLTGAGFLFLAFAWKSWRDAGSGEEMAQARDLAISAVAASFSLLFFAEFGDKTQLALAAIAARGEAPGTVFAAGTLAEWVIALTGIFFGRAVLARVPGRKLHRGASVLFAVFGALMFAEAWRSTSI